MNNYIFHTPVYLKYDAFQQQDLNYLYESYLTLKNQNLLRNFNGTSLLSYDTKIESILDYFNLKEIKEKIRLYSNDYLINCGTSFSKIIIRNNWLIGYTRNEYQGEHNHGYNNNSISGIIYAKVPVYASSIEFISPNPYLDHICIDKQSATYEPVEGMLIIFPSFLKHKVLPNLNIPDGSLRLALSFNAEVF